MSKNTGRAGGGVLVTGDAELDAALKGLAPAVAKKLSRKTTRNIAKNIVLPAARAMAPVDTGDLEESLKVKAIKRSRFRFGHMVTCGEGVFQGEQFYGGFLEFGTKDRFHKKTGRFVGRIAAHAFAFLRPAVYDNAGRARAEYVNDMRELIREVGK